MFIDDNTSDTTGLANLAMNIKIKRIQLGISLKNFATLSNVSYSNLTKIVNQEPVMPSISTLKKLSDFLDLKVPDILKYGNLPQYIPKFLSNEFFLIEKYLDNSLINIKNFEFSESFINSKAFSLEFEAYVLKRKEKIVYFFYPETEIIIGKWCFIKNENDQYDFVEIIDETKNQVLVRSLIDSEIDRMLNLKISQFKILGVAIKKKLLSNI